jgi:TonB family protein
MPPKQILISSKDVPNLDIAIPLTKDVAGRVTVEGNGPSPRLLFNMSEPAGSFAASAQAEPDGTFRVALPEGERRVNLSAPGFTVKAFSYGATDLLRDQLRISAADSAQFNITLSFTGGPSAAGLFSTGTISTIATPFGPIPTPPTGVVTSTTFTSTAAPATAAAVPPNAALVRVSGEVAAANLVSRFDPPYPAAARAIQLSGVVVLSVEITKEGTVQNVYTVTGHPLLVQPAIDAVKQWKYKPLIINNQPTAVVTTVTVSFQYQ